MNKEGRKIPEEFLISKTTRNGVIFFIAVILISILSGALGAFKNGEFQKTYDLISVEVPVKDLDYGDDVFESYTSKSREVFYIRKEIKFNEQTQENFTVETEYYRGYYTKYFFESSWFYLETALNISLMFMFYITFVNFLISKKEEKDKIFNMLSDEINKLVYEDNAIPSSSFEPFLEDWNDKRKKKQYISNMKYKLNLLENKTSFKVRKEFWKKEELENGKTRLVFKKPERPLTKKEERYYSKRERIKSFLDENYIEENAVFEKVKYFKYIYPSFVHSGKNGVHKTNDEYSSMKTSSEVYRNDLFKKLGISLMVTSLFATVLSFTIFRLTDDWIVIAYNILLKFLPLTLQAILAVWYSNIYMNQQLIPNLKNRLNIINIYLSEKDQYKLEV
jgi:hypothetical protein